MAGRINIQQRRVLIIASIAILMSFFVGLAHRSSGSPSDLWNYSKEHVYGSITHPPTTSNDGLAYMTFFSATITDSTDEDLTHDNYFMATRILGYRLMHDPETKTTRDIPFVVLVTENIPEQKRERLRRDGATVIEVPFLSSKTGWIEDGAGDAAWKDLLAKLRAWEQLQYKRILFLDGDMIINKRMDGIFDEHESKLKAPVEGPDTQDFEAQLSEPYLLATMPETAPFHNHLPFEDGDFKDLEYFNAGFFMLAPSMEMFDYYQRYLDEDHCFDPIYVEQNLLNYAHRRNGSAPWQHLSIDWNVRFPQLEDLEKGAVSFHDKFWNAQMDGRLQPYYNSLRWRMEAFYELWDLKQQEEENKAEP